MDFRFRDLNHRSPPLPPPPPPFFSDHAFGGGYPVGDPEIMRGPGCDYYDYDPRQRELEKEQIRKEIIAEEMARRRVLEAEVRRELMMEREMAMRACMSEDRSIMQVDPKGDFGTRGYYALDEGFGFGGRGGGLFERGLPLVGPSLPRVSEGIAAGVLGPLESDRNKLIILPKPKPNISGEKRKEETLLSMGANDPSSLLKKKPKEEWSCALCQVTATSEQGLNDHLKGKKHKNNEAKLRAQEASKNSNKPLKRTAKSRETSTLRGKRKEPNVDAESNQPDESGNGSLLTMDDNKQLTQKDKDEKAPKETNAMAQKENQDKTTQPQFKKKKYKFVCEMCKVGAFSATVMESHKKGKRHMSRLEKVNQGKVAISEATTTGSLMVIEKATVPEATTENLVAVVKKESEASVPEAPTANLVEAIKSE